MWLERIDVSDLLATFDQLAVEVRYADVTHEALFLDRRHGLPRLFDLHVIRGPVQLIQVDVVAPQPSEASLDALPDVGAPEPRAGWLWRELREDQRFRLVL